MIIKYPDKAFRSDLEAEGWVKKFVTWYNYEHLHSEIKYTTPMSRHEHKNEQVLKNRKEVYSKAKENHPGRWMRGIRNWDKIKEFSLKS